MENKYEKFIRFHKPTCENDVEQLIDLLDNSTILDIGSNIGLFTKSIVEKCKYKKIYMFEPIKDFYNFSKDILCDEENICFNNYALGDKDTSMEISINQDMNIGSSSLLRKHENEKKEIVKIKTLDSLNISEKIDFIKIDVEGFETNVIIGGIETIKKNKPVIFTEISFPLNDKQKEIFNNLFEIGYERFDLDQLKSEVNDILILPINFNRTKNKVNSDTTFIMLCMGDFLSFKKTFDSFIDCNTYNIDRHLLSVSKEVQKNIMNDSKYRDFLNNFEFFELKLDKLSTIDYLFSLVNTEYIFYCEDKWEFYKDGFIDNSIKVLKTQNKVIQVWIRPKNDGLLGNVQDKVYTLPLGVSVRVVDQVSKEMMISNDDFLNFNFNPSIKRTKDWKKLSNGYSGLISINEINNYYQNNGYMVVSLSRKDDDGYVKKYTN